LSQARQPCRRRVRTLLSQASEDPGMVEDVSSATALQTWVIEPAAQGITGSLGEFWRYRRLLLFFATRAVKSRYEKTTLGIFWLFARPALPVALNVVVFGAIMGMPSDGLPYPLFMLVGMTPWMVFQRGLLRVTVSVDSQSGLMKKMYFPHLIVPVAYIAPALVEFLMFVVLILVVALMYLLSSGIGYLHVGPSLLMAMPALVVVIAVTLAIGMISTVFQAKHFEVRFVIAYITQFWMFLTPVVYPMSQIPERFRWAMYLNPLSAPVEVFRWSVLGVGSMPVLPFVSSVAVAAVLLVVGVVFFSHYEAAAVDDL
jgi:lipopolysaccharide transport system permease protein